MLNPVFRSRTGQRDQLGIGVDFRPAQSANFVAALSCEHVDELQKPAKEKIQQQIAANMEWATQQLFEVGKRGVTRTDANGRTMPGSLKKFAEALALGMSATDAAIAAGYLRGKSAKTFSANARRRSVLV